MLKTFFEDGQASYTNLKKAPSANEQAIHTSLMDTYGQRKKEFLSSTLPFLHDQYLQQ